MTQAAAIIDELQALGVTLQAHGNNLRFHPREAVAGYLFARLQAHKGELLALLAAEPVTVPSVVDAMVADDLEPQDNARGCPVCGSGDSVPGLKWQWCRACADTGRETRLGPRVAEDAPPDETRGFGVPEPRTLPAWPPVVPAAILAAILAAPRVLCRDCGEMLVVPGQPGKPEGLCFSCWSKGWARA